MTVGDVRIVSDFPLMRAVFDSRMETFRQVGCFFISASAYERGGFEDIARGPERGGASERILALLYCFEHRNEFGACCRFWSGLDREPPGDSDQRGRANRLFSLRREPNPSGLGVPSARWKALPCTPPWRHRDGMEASGSDLLETNDYLRAKRSEVGHLALHFLAAESEAERCLGCGGGFVGIGGRERASSRVMKLLGIEIEQRLVEGLPCRIGWAAAIGVANQAGLVRIDDAISNVGRWRSSLRRGTRPASSAGAQAL